MGVHTPVETYCYKHSYFLMTSTRYVQFQSRQVLKQNPADPTGNKTYDQVSSVCISASSSNKVAVMHSGGASGSCKHVCIVINPVNCLAEHAYM